MSADLLVTGMPPGVTLGLLGLFSGAASMWLYGRVSPQSRLTDITARLATLRLAICNHDGDFAGLWALTLQSLKLSIERVLRVIGPSLLAGLPVVALMLWLQSSALVHQEQWSVGPAWVRSGMTVYFVAVTVAALSVKAALRIR